MAVESANAVAEQAKYELIRVEKTENNKRQKLEKEIMQQAGELLRVDACIAQRERDVEQLQREANRKQRKLELDREHLQQQQSLCMTQCDRLSHERKLLGVERLKLQDTTTRVKKGRMNDRQVIVILVTFVGCRLFSCMIR
jgi:hypothetical protein